MKIGGPNLKGFEKFSQTNIPQSQVNDQPELIKQPFPFGLFGIASGVVALGIIAFFFLSQFSQFNPQPLNAKSSLFDVSTWHYRIEQNAAKRIPLIESASPIKEIAPSGNKLAIRFENDNQVLLAVRSAMNSFPDVEQDVVVENFSGLNNNSAQLILNFDDQAKLEPEYIIKVESYFSDILNNVGIESVSILGFDNRLVSQRQAIQQQSPPQQQIQQKMPSLDSNSEFDSGTPSFNEVSHALYKQELEKLTSWIEARVSNTNQAVPVFYNLQDDFSPQADLDTSGAGILIETTSGIGLGAWVPLTEDAESTTLLPVTSNIIAAWEVSNRDTIDIVFPNQSRKTVAVLPSALNRHFGLQESGLQESGLQEIGTQENSEQASIEALTPRSYPSFMALLALILSIIIALRVLSYRKQNNDADIVKKQKLVDSFVSDSPASELSQDKLGFSEISSALSRFLRNVGTKAPLTLAITGAWGSGKSSLMYFLKENLVSFNMRPVWVNAWHHQNEEQFLAGLLSAIRQHTIPDFWTSAGLLYRWNLLKIRWADAPVFYYSFAFIFLGSMAFIFTSDVLFLSPTNEVTIKSLPYFSALAGAYPLIRGGMDRISGLAKVSILQSIFGNRRQNLDLRANVALREKFASEFGMLCDALGDSTLTIFIDDLDRCKEKRIMDVMETINYLVSSGDCFIVIGMEREPVEKAVAAYYKETHSELDNTTLEKKARRYLEKIINIEIPVPDASMEQFNALVKVKETAQASSKLAWLKPTILSLLLVGSIGLGHYLASFVVFEPAASSFETNGSENKKDNAGATNQTDSNEIGNNGADNNASDGQGATGDSSDRSNNPANSTPEPQVNYTVQQTYSENSTLWVIVPLIVLVIIGMVIRAERYRQRKRIVENDSEPFLAAIAVWAQVMGLSKKTPRSIKRFVNRTRFLAMRNLETDTNIREERLVTLAALIDIAKDKGLADIEHIAEYLPEIGDPELHSQVHELLLQTQAIEPNKKLQLQRWIRGVNVS